MEFAKMAYPNLTGYAGTTIMTIPTGATADANIDFEIDDRRWRRRIREWKNRRTDAYR